MKWRDLPLEIQEKMLCRQAEQNEGCSDPEVFINSVRSPISEKGFMWSRFLECCLKQSRLQRILQYIPKNKK